MSKTVPPPAPTHTSGLKSRIVWFFFDDEPKKYTGSEAAWDECSCTLCSFQPFLL